MIRYRLKCADAHKFEAWLRSSASYEDQAERRQICCPDCGSREVVKSIMAPNVSVCREQRTACAAAPKPDAVALLQEVRRSLLTDAEDVGTRFPEEARKIHYGEAEARGICGTATAEETRALLDEGIEVLVCPPLPEDAN